MLRFTDTVRRWTTLLLAASLAIFLIAGCSTESDDIPEDSVVTPTTRTADGWDLLEEGDIEAAIEAFTASLNDDATNLDAYLGLGYAYGFNNQAGPAQQNLRTTVSLARILNPTNLNQVLAEAFIGRSMVELSQNSYADAAAQADSAINIVEGMSNFTHRYMTGFGEQQVKMLAAEGYYGNGEYDKAMHLVAEYSTGFIAASNNVIQTTESRPVGSADGAGMATISLGNNYLIEVTSVATASGWEQEITDYTIGGNSVTFRGAPVPAVGDSYDVTYYYSDDFAPFLGKLKAEIESLQ